MQTDNDTTEFINWLKELGFLYNPFQILDGSRDCLNHFIAPDNFDLMIKPRSALIIGKEGWGKTACKRLLEKELRISKSFVISLQEKYLHPSVTLHKELSCSLTTSYINAIIQQVISQLLKYLLNRPEIFGLVLEQCEQFKSIICSIPFNFISSIIDQKIKKNTGLTCNNIIKANKEDKLEKLIVDKDQDQQSLIRLCSMLIIFQESRINNNFISIFNEIPYILKISGFKTLYILMEHSPLHSDENFYFNSNIHFKIFLPSILNLNNPIDGWENIEIDWPFEKKMELVERRLEEASIGNTPPYKSISQIFWNKGIGNKLDEEIAQSSDSPAELIRLAGDVLFELYRQKDSERFDNSRLSQAFNKKPTRQKRQKTKNKTALRILHISDIHANGEEQTKRQFEALANDLTLNLKVDKLHYVLITGDIASTANKKEYDIAEKCIKQIVDEFRLKKDNIIIAPGNHDLDWRSTEKSYKFIPMGNCPKRIPEREKDLWIQAGEAGFLKRSNNKTYKTRFANFRRFHKNICNTEYPEIDQDQIIVRPFEDDRMLIVSMNSAWNIDHLFTLRASINIKALDKALRELRANWKKYNEWLKIAIWHHPVTTLESMNNDFMQNLAQYNFDIIMHGHIHKANQDFYRYDKKRKIRIIGAGAFGAPISELPHSISHQYHLLTIRKNKIRVDTRKKSSPDGIWVADPRHGDIILNPRPYIEFTYRRRGK